MKNLALLLTITVISFSGFAQEIVELPFESPATVTWEGDEKAYFSDVWQTEVVTNVSKPTMEVFRPENPNGSSVVIAPGGGLYALSIESEGNMVARWLNEKGVTAFVLKYRLVPTKEDATKEINEVSRNNPLVFMERVQNVMPYSVTDGLNALAHVRKNAENYGVDPQKIGFMGFSAGGAVTMGVAAYYQEESKPNFIVPVYAWTTAMPVMRPREDAPPALVICASDDPLDLAPGSVQIYNQWLQAGKSTGLHMYAKGGHGFGMRTQGLPSDRWIERFYDWAVAEGLMDTGQ